MKNVELNNTYSFKGRMFESFADKYDQNISKRTSTNTVRNGTNELECSD